MHYVAVGLGSLWAALSASGIALSLTDPGIIADAPLDAVGAFCEADKSLQKTQPKNNKGKNSLIEGRVQISPVKSLSSLRAHCVFLAASSSLCSNVFFFALLDLSWIAQGLKDNGKIGKDWIVE